MTPAKVQITRELTNDGRALAPRCHLPKPAGWSPDALPITNTPAHARRPGLSVIRCSTGPNHALSRTRASHQFPQPGLLERRTPATISFTSPKLTRKPSPPGPSPEVTVRDHHLLPGGPSVIQAA